jgi:putative GTP pyrophosphokinase
VSPDTISSDEQRLIDDLVQHYQEEYEHFDALTNSLRALAEIPRLAKLCHSARWRVKDPVHLRDKLERKLLVAKGASAGFEINRDNLFERVNDLAGLRLLHLHTTEFPLINEVLLELLSEYMYEVIEGPIARTWDLEYQRQFEKWGIATRESERMYTSVHYVVKANTRTRRTGEIQVRTLAEELWGEVDHNINYPLTSTKLACREQIKVLARVTSSCTRLVDSIFATHEEQ